MRKQKNKVAARKAVAAIALAGFALSLPACGGGGEESSTLDTIRQTGKITVGVKADQPGVGSHNPRTGKFEGFDVEMAKLVAAAIGVDPDKIAFKEVVSKNREAFIKNGTVDIVIASYSIYDSRRRQVGQAGPYYETRQQLLIRKEDKDTITGPDRLEGRKVCSAVGSSSIKNVEGLGAEPVPFSAYTECVQLLLSKSIDAVTTDGAILLGYAAQRPDELEVLPQSFGANERYGIGFKKGDTEFCDLLRRTIERSFQDGTWRDAFDRSLGKSGVETPEPPQVDPNCWERPLPAESKGGVLVEKRSQILNGFRSTLSLFLFAAVCSLIFGTALAGLRVSPVPMLRAAGTAYVNAVRNTPLVLVFIFITFGLPALALHLSFFVRAVLALTLYTSAFVCEGLRSGINAVHPGQAEAARSIGMTFGQSLSLVVLPQAFRTAIPPLASILIALAKNTAIAEAFGVTEAAFQLDSLVRDYSDQLWSLFLGIAFGYVILTLTVAGVARLVESKVAIAR